MLAVIAPTALTVVSAPTEAGELADPGEVRSEAALMVLRSAVTTGPGEVT